MTIRTIYLCHHSHTDIGYTHPQPIVTELHRRFIDRALDLIDAGRDRGDATFRWTCEVTWAVEHWLEHASERDRARFVAAAERGQLEVCAMWCNVTPLCSIDRLIEMLEPAQRLRSELGLDITVAMNSDVNGQAWALTDLLLDAGVRGFTMAINEHFGGAPRPCPGAFNWLAPSGRTLPVFNGPTYAHTAWLGFIRDTTPCAEATRTYLRRLEDNGYPHDFMYMQITHNGPQNDNMGPIPTLAEWVELFNAQNDDLRLVITTPGAFFRDVLAPVQAELPTHSGEWSDWWNFGASSSPRETYVNLQSQARLRDADALTCLHPGATDARLRAAAARAIDLYNEHTWGADCAIHYPGNPDTYAMWSGAAAPAFEAHAYSTMLRRDGMTRLASAARNEHTPGIVVFNPSSQHRRETIRVARRLLGAHKVPLTHHDAEGRARGWPADQSYQHLVDRDLWQSEDPLELGPIELPPLSWTVVRAGAEREPEPSLIAEGHRIGNAACSAEMAAKPGVRSISVAGREWVRHGGEPFGALVCEAFDDPRDSSITTEFNLARSAIFEFDDSDLPYSTRKPRWNDNVPVERLGPTRRESVEITTTRSAAIATERYTLPTCAAVRARWAVIDAEPCIRLDLEIDKLAATSPHGLYLPLPFAIEQPTILAEEAGTVIDAAHERIPGSAPWLSIQGGFCLGDERSTVYVAAPDTPLLQLRRFAIGQSHIESRTVEHPGLALPWLYNNLWETNFRADDSGTYRMRFIFRFEAGPPSATTLLRHADRARHDLLCHPLPAEPMSAGAERSTSSMLAIEPSSTHLLAVRPDPSGNAGRIVLLVTNPEGEPGTFRCASAALRIHAAESRNMAGGRSGAIPVTDGRIAVDVPPRRTIQIALDVERDIP